MLAELSALGTNRYVPSTCFALVHLGLGEREQALQWLEKGCEQHELPLSAIKVHPIWDPLRPEPRFRKLLNRMRFE
jgi:serine/threonine-protein kinase